MILKLGMEQYVRKLYKVYITDDPRLTLTYFTAKSNWVTYMVEWGKLYQSYLMGENLQQRTKFTEYIIVFMKKKIPQGGCLLLRVGTRIVQPVNSGGKCRILLPWKILQ